nr:putative f-box protein [Quercus suber]
MSQHIPAEVAYNILTQLPVKSIIRFRCVSKSWNFIFTDPIFITTNYKFNQAKSLSNNSHNGYLLYKDVKESHIVVCNNGRSLSRVCSFEIPSIHDHIVGFCNGLFCFTNTNRTTDDDVPAYPGRGCVQHPHSAASEIYNPIQNEQVPIFVMSLC